MPGEFDVWNEDNLRAELIRTAGHLSARDWEHLAVRSVLRDSEYEGWETDPEEREALLEDLRRYLTELRIAKSPGADAPHIGRKERKYPEYEPSMDEQLRTHVVGHYLTACLDVHPTVKDVRRRIPKAGQMSVEDVGKFLTNPLNWLLMDEDATGFGLSCVEDHAEIVSINYSTMRGLSLTSTPLPFVTYKLDVRSKSLKPSAGHFLHERIMFAGFPSSRYAQIMPPNKTTSMWNFFMHHDKRDALFPAGSVHKLAQEPAYCYLRSSLGVCTMASIDLANAFDLDVRDVLLYLLIDRLAAPSLAVIASQEVPTFDDGWQITEIPTPGPIHMTILPWMKIDAVRGLFAQLQRNVRGDRDLRPVRNIEVFYFVNLYLTGGFGGQPWKNGKPNWKGAHDAWKNAGPEFNRKAKMYTSPVTFRTAYMDTKKALFPPSRIQSDLVTLDAPAN